MRNLMPPQARLCGIHLVTTLKVTSLPLAAPQSQLAASEYPVRTLTCRLIAGHLSAGVAAIRRLPATSGRRFFRSRSMLPVLAAIDLSFTDIATHPITLVILAVVAV